MTHFLTRAALAAATTLFWAGVATAEMTEEQALVISCLESMGVETEWEQCVTLLFSPCAEQEVGSEGHVVCLEEERTAWQATMQSTSKDLTNQLTPVAATELSNLMGQWFGYVGQKCTGVAQTKTGTGARAAQLGCEISEISGVVAEFVACARGISTAPYCMIQE